MRALKRISWWADVVSGDSDKKTGEDKKPEEHWTLRMFEGNHAHDVRGEMPGELLARLLLPPLGLIACLGVKEG